MVKSKILTNKKKTADTSGTNHKNSESFILTRTVLNKAKEHQYLRNYAQPVLINKIPNTRDSLKFSHASLNHRASVIDLITSKLFTLKNDFLMPELFKSICVLDLYMKHGSISSETNLELVAIACLFLCVKYETRISSSRQLLSYLVEDSIWEDKEVLILELDILSTLGFNLKYLSFYDLFCSYYHSYLAIELDSDEIRTIGLKLLLVCMLDPYFSNICASKLCLSVLLTAMKYYSKTVEVGSIDELTLESLRRVYDRIEAETGNVSYFSTTVFRIMKHVRAFSKRFTGCSFIASSITFYSSKLTR